MRKRRLDRLLADLATSQPSGQEREAFERCEAARAALLEREGHVGDVGSSAEIPVAQEAARASVPPAKGRLLYRLVHLVKPEKTVELGSALGVSGSYIAAGLVAAASGRLVTIEGSPSRQQIARETIESVAPGVTRYVTGYFDDHLEELDGAVLVFVDGNHAPEPLRRYVSAAIERGARPCVLVLDDIETWSRSFSRAWRRLARSSDFSLAGRAEGLGVLVVGDLPALSPPRRP